MVVLKDAPVMLAPKEAKPGPPGINIKGSPTLHTTTPRPDKPDANENTHKYY